MSAGMTKNHKLARAMNDAGFGMLRQFIEYKAELRDCQVIIADRFFPSSKRCSTPACNFVNKSLSLSDREWDCPECGARDHNASVNLNQYRCSSTLNPTQKWHKTYFGAQLC